MVTSQQVQEFLEARRLAYSDLGTFQNARQALIGCDKTELRAHVEARLQLDDEEEHASAVEGLALL